MISFILTLIAIALIYFVVAYGMEMIGIAWLISKFFKDK